MTSRVERGQATVELAISMILLTVLFLLLLQVGLVARDQVLVTQAAREGARAAAVDPASGAAAAAAARATGLSPSRIAIFTGPRPDQAGMVTVTVRYKSRIVLPVANRVLLEPELRARAAMRVE